MGELSLAFWQRLQVDERRGLQALPGTAARGTTDNERTDRDAGQSLGAREHRPTCLQVSLGLKLCFRETFFRKTLIISKLGTKMA